MWCPVSLADPIQSSPMVGGEVVVDGPRTAAAGVPHNNTAHLASANYADRQDQVDLPRRAMVVKHPEYANRATRLASYANFPRHMKQHPADMTDAGFYYAGRGFYKLCKNAISLYYTVLYLTL
jgi:hypothetical protein